MKNNNILDKDLCYSRHEMTNGDFFVPHGISDISSEQAKHALHNFRKRISTSKIKQISLQQKIDANNN